MQKVRAEKSRSDLFGSDWKDRARPLPWQRRAATQQRNVARCCRRCKQYGRARRGTKRRDRLGAVANGLASEQRVGQRAASLPREARYALAAPLAATAGVSPEPEPPLPLPLSLRCGNEPASAVDLFRPLVRC